MKAYQAIEDALQDSHNRLTIKELCAISNVSRSGFYRWRAHSEDRLARDQQDYEDFLKIQEAYSFRGYDRGVMGLHMRLLHMGIRMNHKKIRRLMHKYGLKCPIRKANPYRRMAKALRTNAVADNHVKREFRKHGLRKILLTDITYIPYNGTFVYLSVIIDAFTKQVLAYELSESLEVDFVLRTVKSVIKNHGETLKAEAYIHSDQGCHYTSIAFRELLGNVGLRQSMTRRGNCWDNAPQESFFGHMKDELKKQFKTWNTFDAVQKSIDDWMDYYNNDRYQEGLEKLSPNEYYTYITTGEYPIQC